MNRAEVRAAVRVRAGLTSTDRSVSDTDLNSLITESARQFGFLRDWAFFQASTTLTATSSVDYVTVSNSVIRKILRMYNTTDQSSMQRINPQAADRYKNMSGEPRFWWTEGTRIYYAPKPTKNTTLTYTYQSIQPVITDDTTQYAIPNWAIPWLIVKVAVAVAARLDNTSQFRLLKEELREIESALMDDVRRGGGAPIIHSRRDWYVN